MEPYKRDQRDYQGFKKSFQENKWAWVHRFDDRPSSSVSADSPIKKKEKAG
jgi:hypothetical protein